MKYAARTCSRRFNWLTLTAAAAFTTKDAMRRCLFGFVAIAATFFNLDAKGAAPRELAVAIRYLQAEGTSHAHLYLFREDGKLLRQLTNDNSGQDFDPIFAPDGATIVFSREKAAGAVEFWTVDPRGQNAKALETVPEWYPQTRSSPYFTNFDEPEPEAAAAPSPEPTPSPGDKVNPDPPRTYRAPDGSVEVVVQRLANDEDDNVDGEGTGKHFLLRDIKAGTETEMGTLPGFLGLWDILRLRGELEHVYLFEGPLRVAFSGCI
ncbi:MAG: TolB family protein [Chthoniobacterales bacterium]